MAYIDDYLARIGGLGMTPRNASPYTSPQSFQSAFGTTPVNIGGMSGLPGGTAPIAKTTGISPMRGIGFGGIANPTTPPMPPRGFGTRVADLFKDQNKFADALTGLALLSGTPSDRALGIRQALQPTTPKSSSIGTILNVYDQQGQFVRQITSKDQALADQYLSQGYKVLPADSTQLSNMGVERGDVEKETNYDPTTGETTYFGTRLVEQKAARRKIASTRDAIIEAANKKIQQINTAISLTRKNTSTATNLADTLIFDRLSGSDQAVLRGELSSISGSNFVDVINAMKQASANGGALGSVSETELNVFSNLNYVLDTDAVGTGEQLRIRLQQMKDDTIKGVQAAIKFAAESWVYASDPIPKDDPEKLTPIPEPIPLLTDENIRGNL